MDVHGWDQDKGWSGIGCHYFVTKSGEIYKCRPVECKGAYMSDRWWENLSSSLSGKIEDKFIGICFEGDFYEESMCRVQEDAVVMLIAILSLVYEDADVLEHRNLEYEETKKANSKDLYKFPFGTMSRKVDLCKNNLKSIFGSGSDHSFDYGELLALTDHIHGEVAKDEKKSFAIKDVKFNMVKVAGGSFWMGAQKKPSLPCYDEDLARSELSTAGLGEAPPHQVTLHDFYLCETVVTNGMWEAVMGDYLRKQKDSLPERWSDFPVEQVSWNDCQEFICKLNALTGQVFRLPSEAEWEYAAKGGVKTHHYTYSGSDKLDDVALVTNASQVQTRPVKGKQPNELGLYDMTGNVWEWCDDWYANYDLPDDKTKREVLRGDKSEDKMKRKVLRGGGWANNQISYRNTYRELASPDERYYRFGFRLALSAE